MDILDAIAQDNLKILKQIHEQQEVHWNEAVQDESGNHVITPLIHACQHNKVTIMDWLFDKHHVDTNKAQGSVTPLFVACENGDLGLVQYLIEKGAHVNHHVGDEKLTPLHVAIDNEHVGVVKELIKRGANVNILSNHGTPLLEAARTSSMQCAKILLECGADVNKTSPKTNETPLHKSAELGYISLIKLLMTNGADLTQRLIGTEYTPLHVAVEHGRNGSLDYLLLKYSSTTIDVEASGVTALGIAAKTENMEFMKALIKKGADVNHLPAASSSVCSGERAYGLTPLMAAALHGNCRAVELLLSKGAKPNIRNEAGNSALHYALFSNQGDNNSKDEAKKLKLCTMLVKQRASSTLQNKRHVSPCYYALRRRYISIFDLFLAKGAGANERDRYESTAFHHLAGQPNVYMLMAKYRADPNLKTADGYTVLHLAAASYNTKPADLEILLTDFGAQVTQSLDGEFPYHLVKRLDVMELFKSKGYDLNATTRGGDNIVHCAIRNRFAHSDIRKLLKWGTFDFEARSTEGLTADGMAKVIGDSDLVRVLKDAKNKKEGTASPRKSNINDSSKKQQSIPNSPSKTTKHNGLASQKQQRELDEKNNSDITSPKKTSKQNDQDIQKHTETDLPSQKEKKKKTFNKSITTTKKLNHRISEDKKTAPEKLPHKNKEANSSGNAAEHTSSESNTNATECEIKDYCKLTDSGDVFDVEPEPVAARSLKKKDSAEESKKDAMVEGCGKRRSCSFSEHIDVFYRPTDPSDDDASVSAPRRCSFYDSPESGEDEVIYDGYDEYFELGEEESRSSGKEDKNDPKRSAAKLEGIKEQIGKDMGKAEEKKKNNTTQGGAKVDESKISTSANKGISKTKQNIRKKVAVNGTKEKNITIAKSKKTIATVEVIKTTKARKTINTKISQHPTKLAKKSAIDSKAMKTRNPSEGQNENKRNRSKSQISKNDNNDEHSSVNNNKNDAGKIDNKENKEGEKKNTPCDVIILYHPNSSQKADQISEFIRQHGKAFVAKQWHSTSTADNFQQKIKQSKMVILLLTEDFKSSCECLEYCRYADRYFKVVYPLKVETVETYVPTSLLDLMVGDAYHYDVEGRYKQEMDKLLHKIKEILHN